MTKTKTNPALSARRGSTSVPAYRISPTLRKLGIDVDEDTFLAAVDIDRDLNERIRTKRERLAAIQTDRTIDPEDVAEEAAKLTHEIEHLGAAQMRTQRDAERARGALNGRVAAALRSEEAIAHSIEVDEKYRTGQISDDIDELIRRITDLVNEALEGRRFRSAVLAAQRAVITGQQYDAEYPSYGLANEVEHPLQTVKDHLTLYPWAGVVRQALTKEADWHRVEGISTSAKDYPAGIQAQIAKGLDGALAARWLRGS